MPLSREQWAAYGSGWADLSRAIREERAAGRCECAGECGWTPHQQAIGQQISVRCEAINGRPSPYTGSRVVLTVAHLDRNAGEPGHENPERLKAMCQGCHLSYDRRA